MILSSVLYNVTTKESTIILRKKKIITNLATVLHSSYVLKVDVTHVGVLVAATREISSKYPHFLFLDWISEPLLSTECTKYSENPTLFVTYNEA